MVANRHYTLHCQRSTAPLGFSSPCPQSACRHLLLNDTVNVYDFRWTYLIIHTITHTKPTIITADLPMHSTKSGILKICEGTVNTGKGKDNKKRVFQASHLTSCLTKNIVTTSPNSGLILFFSQSNFECRSYNKQSE